MFTDSHTHIYSDEYASARAEAVERAIQAGVTRLFMPNIDTGSISPMLDLAQKFPDNCYPMMGLHPTSVGREFENELKIIKEYLFGGSFSAVGEIGIDLYWDKTFLSEQTEVFKRQIRWALELELPVVIHSRESFKEIFEVLDVEHKGKLKGVFHSFTGDRETAEKALSYGFFLGINGIITFKNSSLPEILMDIPPERLLLETDSPYLSPVPYRGKRNESSYLPLIAEKIAGIYGLTPDEIGRITTGNALSLFKI